MYFIHRHARILVLALSCVAIGAGASAIASAGASGSAAPRAKTDGIRARELRGAVGHAVQGTFIIHTPRQGFVRVSFRRGTIDSVSGQSLTLTEGTRTASYKTVTVTIPSAARVRDNRRRTTLSALKPGQRVLILGTPSRTFVIAHTPMAH